MPEERILDCRGLQCPMPVVKTKRALADLEQGVLVVMVDNEISSRNVARAAERAGCVVQVQRDQGVMRVRIAKGESVEEAPAPAPVPAQPQPQPSTQTAVFVASSTFGRGDDELGAVLMKGFLYALSQLPSPPGALILANTGVRLGVEGSEHLDSLRALAEAGTDVILCGTCLDYFGLAEKVAVGRVSNMYEIVETLAGSAKIISP